MIPANEKITWLLRLLKSTIHVTIPALCRVMKAAKRFLRLNCFDQWYLSGLLDFDRVYVCRWTALLESLPIPFAIAPSRLDDPPLVISRLPLPARL